MIQFNRLDFLAWEESGETAFALVDRFGWFDWALNCMRDGDMGERGDDGIYTRYWASDELPYKAKTRPMTEYEVDRYLKHLRAMPGAEPKGIFIRSREGSYILTEAAHETA